MDKLDPETLEKLRRGFPLHMDRQGNFSFEGDPVSHAGIVALFRTKLDASESGEVTLGLDGKWVYLEVADLPLRALRVDAPRGEREHGPQLLLDDGRRVGLEVDTLWEEPDLGLRCTVPAQASGRALAVRLLNAAAMDLSGWMEWDAQDDESRPWLVIDGRRISIPEVPPAASAS